MPTLGLHHEGWVALPAALREFGLGRGDELMANHEVAGGKSSG